MSNDELPPMSKAKLRTEVGQTLILVAYARVNDQLTPLEHDGSKAIVLDLRDLRFIDSSGLHAFVQAHKRSLLNGHRFLLVGASPIARRLFEITRTEFLLDVEGTAQLLDRFTGDGSRPGNQDDEVGAERHA